MTELDIGKVVTGLPVPPTNGAALNDWVYTLSRAIIAAHTEKLLAGAEMPESATVERADDGSERDLFTIKQLQSYAAAAALNARVKALEALEGNKRTHWMPLPPVPSGIGEKQ